MTAWTQDDDGTAHSAHTSMKGSTPLAQLNDQAAALNVHDGAPTRDLVAEITAAEKAGDTRRASKLRAEQLLALTDHYNQKGNANR